MLRTEGILQDVRLLYRAPQRSQAGPPLILISVAQLEMEIGRGPGHEIGSHLFGLEPHLETVMGELDAIDSMMIVNAKECSYPW